MNTTVAVVPPVVRICKDCRWSKPLGGWFFPNWSLARCSNPAVNTVTTSFLVTGQPKGEFCSVERMERISSVNSACGTAGRLWEPRP